MPATAGTFRNCFLRAARTSRTSRAPALVSQHALVTPRAVTQRGRFLPSHSPLRTFATSSPFTMPASAETKDYRFNHTMLRVKDPKASLHFYCDILGMDVIDEHDAGDFKLFFLAYANSASADAPSRAHREAILELTWNKGTEKESGQVYHNGNDQPQGFGHTCISVPDLDEACARFEKLGVEFKKKPTDGRMRSIAFIYDPDRYWVEVIPQNKKDV